MGLVDDDDWHVLPSDWWQISFTDVSWQDSDSKILPHSPHSLFIHGSVEGLASADKDLSTELAGVRVVEDVVAGYERDVGFKLDEETSIPEIVDLTVEVDDELLALHKERWEQFMSDLMEPLQTDKDLDDCSTNSSDLSSSISSLSGVDWSPRIPKAVSPCPSPPVEISFPTIASPPTAHYPSFTNFTFPSLSAPLPLPPVKIRKDEQGFYSVEQTTGPRQASAAIPPFLHSTRRKGSSSKTRSIVDGLRKADVRERSQSPTPSPPFADRFVKQRNAVSEDGGDRDVVVEEGADGWIGNDQADVAKSRRSRDLFRALRRRSDSTPSNSSKGSSQDISLPALSPSGSPSRSSSVQSSSDGWMEGIVPPTPKVKPRKRQRKQNSSIIQFPSFPPAYMYMQAPSPYYMGQYRMPTVPVHPHYGYVQQMPMHYPYPSYIYPGHYQKPPG